MNRRMFLKLTGSSVAATSVFPSALVGISASEKYAELKNHSIDRCEIIKVDYRWPRFVGKNGRIGFHGQDKRSTILKLYTDKGAMGWGLTRPNAKELFSLLKGKKVSELIAPGKGISDVLDRRVDLAMHDLMGKILNEPVYKLIGGNGSKENRLYSGMIYLDELNPGNETKGLDAIIENCEWDYNYGYRQFKVKIGRSGRWYPHDEGLKKDIEVIKLIHEAFKDRDIEILVDANDMYSLEDTITFLKGINDIPLYWVEEPFIEELESGRKLKKWMMENGFENTYYADGERNPDFDVCLQLGKEKKMDVFLPDIASYGFTAWLKLMPQLKEMNMLTSPHNWGKRLKTHYTAHFAAGVGNVCTIEGVTCESDEIDYGDYPIINGKIKVSDAPGFGMKLLNEA